MLARNIENIESEGIKNTNRKLLGPAPGVMIIVSMGILQT